jgi:hypothetical protein
MKKHLSPERRAGVPANVTGRAAMPDGTADICGSRRTRYARPDRPHHPLTLLPSRAAVARLPNSLAAGHQYDSTTVQIKSTPLNCGRSRRVNRDYGYTGLTGGDSRERIGGLPASTLRLHIPVRQSKGGVPPPCGCALPAIPHPAPDAKAASLDCGQFEVSSASSASYASDAHLAQPTLRAPLGSVAPGQSDKAVNGSRFAFESCAFVKSVVASTAPPLFKKRGSKVIVRVTRKSLTRLSASLRTYLAPAGGSGPAAGFGGIRNPRRFPSRSRRSAGGQTGTASLRSAPGGRSYLWLLPITVPAPFVRK